MKLKKRRPERKRPNNEVKINFANRLNMFRAQAKFREVSIHFRLFGVSLFVNEADEVKAGKAIKDHGIELSEGI